MIIGCFLLQTTVFSNFKLAGVTPNFLVILVSYIGFMRGRKDGMVVGIVCGILLDLFIGSVFGLYSIIFLFLGYLNGLLRQFFFGDDIKLPLFLVGISDIVYGLFIYFALFLFRGRADFLYYVMNIILPEAVYTIVISILLYYPMIRLNTWLDKKDKRGAGSIV